MSKSDSKTIRTTESLVPRSARRTDRQTDKALRDLTHGYAHEIWDDVEELEGINTRRPLTHKQQLR
jgi:hypothetical protein